MCYRVDCSKCGKPSWGGCGKHLTTLYASIEQGKHCMCRSWPGVRIPSLNPTIQSQPQPSVASVSTSAPASASAGN